MTNFFFIILYLNDALFLLIFNNGRFVHQSKFSGFLFLLFNIGFVTVSSVAVVCLIKFSWVFLVILNLLHDIIHFLSMLLESFKEYFKSVHHDVCCFHHFRWNVLPFPINAAEYRKQFNQVEWFFGAFLWCFVVHMKVGSVCLFPAKSVRLSWCFVQETGNFVCCSVYHCTIFLSIFYNSNKHAVFAS